VGAVVLLAIVVDDIGVSNWLRLSQKAAVHPLRQKEPTASDVKSNGVDRREPERDEHNLLVALPSVA
jgi:hypothetical protein